MPPVTLLPLPAGSRPDTVTLRSTKSEESLSSQASGAGEHSCLCPGGAGRDWGPELASKWCFQIWGSWIFFIFNLDRRYNKLDKASPLFHDAL